MSDLPLPISSLNLDGFELVKMPYPAPRLYQERERFSGGYNRSAQERNAERRREWHEKNDRCYLVKRGQGRPRDMLVIPQHLWEQVKAEFASVSRYTDDDLDRGYAELNRQRAAGLGVSDLERALESMEEERANEMREHFLRNGGLRESEVLDLCRRVDLALGRS